MSFPSEDKEVKKKPVEGYFITGTDTGVGKTRVACELMKRLKSQGHCVVGFKPVASGAILTPDGLRNKDALALQAASSMALPYEWINPYCFEEPVAPHLAASKAGAPIRLEIIEYAYSQMVAAGATAIVVEGAGGWLVPINETQFMSDIADQLNLQIVLVIAIRLGCLNHGLMTANHLQQTPEAFMGWVANYISNDTLMADENVQALTNRIGEPMMVYPYSP